MRLLFSALRRRTPNRWLTRERLRPWSAVALVAGLLAGCDEADYPEDPNDTLASVLAAGEVRVAAVAHPPWVILDEDVPPTGAEVALVRDFADELGVEIDWHRLSAFDALKGLEQNELDLAIGGFTRSHVASFAGAAPTYGYFTETLLIAARPDADVREELEGRPVYVPLEIMAEKFVRDRGGIPVAQMDEDVELAALPQWWIESLDLLPTGMQLRKETHVMVVPQGENAWLMRLETFLRSETHDMGERLRDYRG